MYLVYVYDDSGAPMAIHYRRTGSAEDVFYTYYLEKNLQGDVVALYNSGGTVLARYTYDAWGNCTTTYYNGGASTGAQFNPFRYRGYYYDSDFGFYYLNSRYYDANTGRFINADDISYLGADETITSFNLYVYCGNNPVMGYDPMGNVNWGNILKAAAAVVAVTALVVATVATVGAAAVAVGAASATVATAATIGATVGGLTAGAVEIANQCTTVGSDNIDYGAVCIESFYGSLYGTVDGISATVPGIKDVCAITRVVLSGGRAATHGVNENKNGLQILDDTLKGMMGTAVLQVPGLLKKGGISGYGAKQVASTAGARALAGALRNDNIYTVFQ